MNLTGYGYLLTLAELSVGFAAISTIVVALRSVLGAKLSAAQIHLMHGNIERGLTIMASSLLPPMLALFGLRPSVVWALASISVAAFLGVYQITFFNRQRRLAAGFIHPIFGFAHYTIALMGYVPALLLNASGIFFEPCAAPYVAVFTLGLYQSVHVFLYTLDDFLEQPPGAQALSPGGGTA